MCIRDRDYAALTVGLNGDSGALASGQVLFAVLPDSESGVVYGNTDFALWEDGRVAAPLGLSLIHI